MNNLLKKAIACFLFLSLTGCVRYHYLTEEKEFIVDPQKNEEVWSKAHHYLAKEKTAQFSTGFITDYSIILTGYIDNRNISAYSSKLFTPYYYNLTLTRYKNDNDYIYYIRIHGLDIEDPEEIVNRNLRRIKNRNSKESGFLNNEITIFYENITKEARY